MNSRRTKQLIMNVFIDLLSRNKIEKVSVSDIVEKSGITRQTFYNYYIDKYDLMHQIYKAQFDKCISEAKDTSLGYIEVWYNLFKKNRTFYINAFSIDGYGSMTQFLVDLHHKRANMIVKKNGIILNEKQKLRLKIYNYGSVAMIRELLINGSNIQEEELENIFLDAAPDFLRQAWGFYTHDDLN